MQRDFERIGDKAVFPSIDAKIRGKCCDGGQMRKRLQKQTKAD